MLDQTRHPDHSWIGGTYEMLDESLEALLNSGWSIMQASGASPALALVLRRGQQHVICALIGNMQDRQTGRSDCRRLN